MSERVDESKTNSPSQDIECFSSHTGNKISFFAKFFVPVNPSCAADTIYSFDHLKKFMTVGQVELLDQGKDWQDVRYTYKKLTLKIQAVFRRSIEQPGQKIAFAMKRTVPLLSLFSGHYLIKPAQGGAMVEYFHEMAVPPILAWFARYQGVKDVKHYATSARDYIRAVCT